MEIETRTPPNLQTMERMHMILTLIHRIRDRIRRIYWALFPEPPVYIEPTPLDDFDF